MIRTVRTDRRAAAARLRAAALCLVAAALWTACIGCRTSPVTGGLEFNIVSAAEEQSMGDQLHPDIIFMYDGEYLDPELKRYLGTIVQRLGWCTHRPEMHPDFTLVNSSVINAFAIPGHVYATRGFVARIQNEGQFAAVMGHELAHVAAGHSASSSAAGRRSRWGSG
jgi:predicted Zn-dependent protease